MRKLILLLLFPAFLFAQDFRKMSFGQSIEELKETYPATEFVEENEMEETNTWHNDSYKDSPNNYDHALGMGYVDFSESYTTDKVVIKHSVSRSEGIYTHILGYMSPSFRELMSAENESDF